MKSARERPHGFATTSNEFIKFVCVLWRMKLSPLALRSLVLPRVEFNPSLIMRLSCMISGCCCWRWWWGSTVLLLLGVSHMSYSFMYGHDFGALNVSRQWVTINIMNMSESRLFSFTNIIFTRCLYIFFSSLASTLAPLHFHPLNELMCALHVPLRYTEISIDGRS